MVAGQAVFFDGDGTLWDFERLMRRALAETLAHLRAVRPGRETASLDVEALVGARRAVGAELAGQGSRLEELRFRAFAFALERAGLGDAALAQELTEVFLEERFTGVPLFPDVVPVLSELCRRVPIGLLSNGNGHPERSGLEGMFTVCVFSDDFGVAKPDRRLFDEAAAAMHVDPADLVMVGDSLTADVGGALDAGWRAVWLNRVASRASKPATAMEISSLFELPRILER